MRTLSVSLLSFLGLCALSAPLAAHDMFRTMDANHDGKITAAEHAAGAKMMFDKMDTNHDGKITAAECDAGHAKMAKEEAKEHEGMKGMHEAGMKRMSGADMVKQLDTDGDGTVSAAEHARWSEKMFADADTDHDGSLTMAEMKSAMAMHGDMDMDKDDMATTKTKDKTHP
jgi:Ca2+-binding EF-hand superfamily protein